MNAKNDLMRRKFLVFKKPLRFSSSKSFEIEEGYFPRHPQRDLQLRRVHRKYFLVCKENKKCATLQELRLTKAQFDLLWPFTQGQRICFQRSISSINGLEVTLDSFLGEHAPLIVAEVMFPTLAHKKALEAFDFLGEEVTLREEYETISMAMYGAPEPKDIYQVGILPYVIKAGKLYVLLITNSSGNRWILPKGQQEVGMTPHEVALMEGVEEGGVLGTIRNDVRIRTQMSDGRFLQIYAMKVSKLLGSWPEEHLRLRRLVPISQALELLEDPKIRKAVKKLGLLLGPKKHFKK